MKSVAALALLAGSAAAFAPSAGSRAGSALRADLSGEIGATAPLGYWDPFDMTNGGEQETFDALRHIELKHGRVSMLAFVGYCYTFDPSHRLPGCEDFSTGLAALTSMGQAQWLEVFFTVGLLEIWTSDITGNAEFAGDSRNGLDFGWDKKSDDWKRSKRTIEINNGRAAMMGILGLMTHEGVVGNLSEIFPPVH